MKNFLQQEKKVIFWAALVLSGLQQFFSCPLQVLHFKSALGNEQESQYLVSKQLKIAKNF